MTHIVIRLPASGGSRRRNNADTKNLSNVDPLLFLKVFKIVGDENLSMEFTATLKNVLSRAFRII